MTNQRRCLKVVVLVVCLALFALSACNNPASPMQVGLSVSPAPVVGQEVNLHVEIFSRTAAPNTILTVTLPAEVELVSGSLNWSGDIEAKQTASVDLTIRVTQAGEWFVFAEAFHYSQPGTIYGFGGEQALYLRSSADSGEVIEVVRPTSTPPPVHQGNSDVLSPTFAGTQALTGTIIGNVILYGYIHFWVRDQLSTSVSLAPLRHARVEVWDDEVTGDRLLATVYTEADDWGTPGFYSAVVPNGGDADGTGIDPYLKIVATDDDNVEVGSNGNLYDFSTPRVGDNLVDGDYPL